MSVDPGTMRVLFVLPRMVAGGVERATLNLIEGLQREGVDCRLALGRCHGELLAEAQSLTRVDEIARRSKWLFPLGLRRVIARYRPTHLVTAFADVSLMTLVARRLAGSRAALIVGVHGTHGEAAALGGWRVRFQYWLHALVAGPVYRRSAAVVAVSDGVADDVRERYPEAGDRLAVIPNAVLSPAARERLARLPQGSTPGAPCRLVAVGRLAYEKGFDVLLRAMPDVLARFDASLEIHGEGAERASLQAQIEALGFGRHVRLMGATLDPLGVLAASDLFVFPSRHEGFGVALVEALACGCQIVASDCPHGPSEILRQGTFGQLVPPDDPQALAAAMIRSLDGEIRFDPGHLRLRAEDFTAEAALASWVALLQDTGGACAS
jgi:glycosyltransferase involved in cell wall biosynthesis